MNVICPGGILTQIPQTMFGKDFDPEAMRDILASGQPIKRAAEGADIASAALWLASDESSFVTGQFIAVDGGGSVVVNPMGSADFSIGSISPEAGT